jgi:hypothetical protein
VFCLPIRTTQRAEERSRTADLISYRGAFCYLSDRFRKVCSRKVAEIRELEDNAAILSP